jgi:peptidylamidoglycolate lyase
MSEQFLFPSRRDFLAATSASAMAVGLQSALGQDAAAKSPVLIGSGKFTYVLDPNWGKLPEGMNYGHGCAIVVDSQDRIIVTSRSQNQCVAIFNAAGKLLETWADTFPQKIGLQNMGQVAATAHGLYWSKEPAGEFLYWTENKGNANSPGARVYKTDMQGKVLYSLGHVKAGDNSQVFTKTSIGGKDVDCFTNPTDVAVAANGDIYIVDGYGSQYVHKFDKDFKHVKTIGGRGKEHGQFNTCHGVWINTVKKDPEVWIADRANNRIEIYSLDLEYKRTIEGVRTPCCFYQHDGHIYVPELGARVSIIDENDKIVVSMGDGQGIKPPDSEKHPDKFVHPHALTLDSKGNLYVLEWLPHGRVRKFTHVPV